MTHKFRDLIKLVESAALMELDLTTPGDQPPEVKVPVDTLPRDADGRAMHKDIKMTTSTTPASGKKEATSKVVAQLNSYNSQSYTKLAQKMLKIQALEDEVTLLKEDVKQAAREDIAALFSADDVVSTRVVETVSFILTLTKDPKATETVKYASVLTELEKQLTPDLIKALEALKKQYTTVTQKAPALSIKAIDATESIQEGVWDSIKGVLARFAAAIANWGTKYDAKLAALKAEAGLQSDAREFGMESVEDQIEVVEGLDANRAERIEKHVEYLASNGRSRDYIVDQITNKLGDDEGEHAGIYYDAVGLGSAPAPRMDDASPKKRVFGHKYINSEIKEDDDVLEVEPEEGLTEADFQDDDYQLASEYKRAMGTKETMAFAVGSLVYCGSRSGIVLDRAPSNNKAILVRLADGTEDVFPLADCSHRKPSFLKKAAHFVVGEDAGGVDHFDNKDIWYDAMAAEGCEISYWGHGSCTAFLDGVRVGEWIANFDCDNGERPHGWFKPASDLGEASGDFDHLPDCQHTWQAWGPGESVCSKCHEHSKTGNIGGPVKSNPMGEDEDMSSYQDNPLTNRRSLALEPHSGDDRDMIIHEAEESGYTVICKRSPSGYVVIAIPELGFTASAFTRHLESMNVSFTQMESDLDDDYVGEGQLDEISDATVRSAYDKRQGSAMDSQDKANQSHVNGYKKTVGQMNADIAKSDSDVAKRNKFMDLAGKRNNRKMSTEDIATSSQLAKPKTSAPTMVTDEDKHVIYSHRQWLDLMSHLKDARISGSGCEVTAKDFTGKVHMAGMWDQSSRKGWVNKLLVKVQ